MVIYDVDLTAVLVASLVSFIFGFIWYGPAFGKIWKKENKIKKKDQKMKPMSLVYQALTTILLVYVFAALYSVIFMKLWMLALLIWAGFFLTTRIGSLLWVPKPSSKLFWIDVSYHFINLGLIALVLNIMIG